jgi:subtilisin family serine protease
MYSYFRSLILSLTTLLFVNQASFSRPQPYRNSEFLKPELVSVQKGPIGLSSRAREFLAARDGDTVKVWIFFSDKSTQAKQSFTEAASGVRLNEKVLKRRSKVRLDHIVFADLPVSAEYVQAIRNAGGKLRHTSRWLNAASFEIPIGVLYEIQEYPFVSEVRPLGSYKKQLPPDSPLKDERFESQLQVEDALNYGNSAAQITQIKVDVLHNLGYHGEGVTLAILDTGFRKSHQAFTAHYIDNRVLGEYDFIFNDSNTANEGVDDPGQWTHGTFIWSVCGGQLDGKIYGPAYESNFLLAKTEYIPTETQVEEDYWVAGMEWADSSGADVITSSLGYIDWYTSADLDGATAVTTIAANMAASLGIVLCNAAGNEGPGASSLIAPADAFDIMAVGSVNSSGVIANSSSRGPTADGRIKPEVCARGVSTWSASSSTDSSYTTASGTSLATPLVAGAACLLIQARPTFPPEIIRQAFMETASNALSPNNTYGWGIINAEAALNWGAEFSADTTLGNAPLTVQFTANTSLTASAWSWDFGDGDTSTAENPSHQYLNPGSFDVSLTIQTEYGPITNLKYDYVVLFGDTLQFEQDSVFAGNQIVISTNLINSQVLESMIIPFKYGQTPDAFLDSVTFGTRTSYFESLSSAGQDPNNNRFGFLLMADVGGGSPPLGPGSGEVLRMYLTIDSTAIGGETAIVDTTSFLNIKLELRTPSTSYTPVVFTGGISTKEIMRGDANYDFKINILDLTFIVNRIYRGGPPAITIQSADLNADLVVTVLDLTYMVDFMFRGGPPPPSP